MVQVTSGAKVSNYAVSWEDDFTLPPQDADG